MIIVAATDFSDAARAAVGRAALIAREHDAELNLIFAFDENSWANLLSLATPKQNLLADQPLARAWKTIRATAQRLEREYQIRVSGAVATGGASEAIASIANAKQASLVVLGPHGRRAGDRLYFGSTALGMARLAKCPVLVARNKPEMKYARCLVGIDFSPTSLRAATAAAQFFSSAEITLLHAVQPVQAPMLFTGALRAAVNVAREKLRKEALERLARAFPADQPGRLGSAKRCAVVGPAHVAILRALNGRKFDLLALGLDAKAALSERVLGSVPANVLMNASTDVMIVP